VLGGPPRRVRRIDLRQIPFVLVSNLRTIAFLCDRGEREHRKRGDGDPHGAAARASVDDAARAHAKADAHAAILDWRSVTTSGAVQIYGTDCREIRPLTVCRSRTRPPVPIVPSTRRLRPPKLSTIRGKSD